MTEDDLKARGWHTWYNPNYWVHRDSVERPNEQDYTNYGMCFEDAVRYERLGKPKHRSMGLPGLSRIEMTIRTGGLSHAAIEVPTQCELRGAKEGRG
jgi:hypothetical protein